MIGSTRDLDITPGYRLSYRTFHLTTNVLLKEDCVNHLGGGPVVRI
jgi:hypothetical protein